MCNTVIWTSNILKTFQTLGPYILAPALDQPVIVLSLSPSLFRNLFFTSAIDDVSSSSWLSHDPTDNWTQVSMSNRQFEPDLSRSP